MNIIAFLLSLAVFVIAIVYYLIVRQDPVLGGLITALAISVILLTYPTILNRSP